MIIRRERRGDVAAARQVQADAFPTEVEANLLDELREDEGWLPDLSLVAEFDDEVVGHVVCTRGTIGADHRPALGLGPIAVRPDQQGKGLGSALVHAVVAVAESHGETLVALLGSTDFYGRLGFVPATDHGIQAPDPSWGDHFQVRVLDPSAVVAGPFEYAAPFGRL
jgi:putative acetyltransferase